MRRLLVVATSQPSMHSASAVLTDTYLSAIRASTLDVEIDWLDLEQEDVYSRNREDAAPGALRRNTGHRLLRKTRWESMVSLAERVRLANRYVIAVPSWNGGVPPRLKQYLSVVYQPGVLYGPIPESGFNGFSFTKSATLFLSESESTGHSSRTAYSIDKQAKYIRAWLNQAGVYEIDEIRLPTDRPVDVSGERIERAKERVIELAGRHIEFDSASHWIRLIDK